MEAHYNNIKDSDRWGGLKRGIGYLGELDVSLCHVGVFKIRAVQCGAKENSR